MTIHATFNPIGSTNPKDLIDNAQNLDYLILGPLLSYPDRRGVNRLSWAGIESAFAAAQAQRAADYTASEANRGYEAPVPYAAGVTLTRVTQLVQYSSELYKAKAGTLPWTTTGVFATDSAKLVSVGDAALRQDLINIDPTKNVAMLAAPRLTRYQSLQSAVQTIFGALDRPVWVFANLVTVRPTPTDPNTWDWSPAIQMASDIGGPWHMPPNPDGTKADYRIGSNGQGRVNCRTSFYGSRGNRPSCRIITTDTFSDQSMCRQWDASG